MALTLVAGDEFFVAKYRLRLQPLFLPGFGAAGSRAAYLGA